MYYIILKKQNQDIGTKIKNLKIKNPINSSHRKKNWLVFFCSHWEETCSDLWEQWGRRVEVVILVKCPVFQQYNQRHIHESTKRKENTCIQQHKNMCHFWHFSKALSSKNINAHIWAGLQFHIYWFLNIKFYIINIYVM